MKCVVLVSGGLDSAVCLAGAVSTYGKENVIALSMYYGQKHSKETLCAEQLCSYYGVKRIERDLSKVFEFSDCSLLAKNDDKEIAKGSYAEQQSAEGIDEGAVATYVPFRNGLFLSYATAIAYQVGASTVIYGAHADDAAGSAYPDCSPEFEIAMNQAISTGTGNKVKLTAPLVTLTKAGVVEFGLRLKVPFELTWSCYEGHDKACGKCGTCIDRIKAFRENGMEDPIAYEE